MFTQHRVHLRFLKECPVAETSLAVVSLQFLQGKYGAPRDEIWIMMKQIDAQKTFNYVFSVSFGYSLIISFYS